MALIPSVSGTVQVRNGTGVMPLAKATVRGEMLNTDNRQFVGTQTAQNGVFCFEHLTPGEWVVSVSVDDHVNHTQTVMIDDGEVVDLDIVLTPVSRVDGIVKQVGSFAGSRYKGSDGKQQTQGRQNKRWSSERPAVGAVVQAFLVSKEPTHARTQSSALPRGTFPDHMVITDAQGAFRFDALIPGTWEFVALHNESVKSGRVDRTLPTDTRDVSLEVVRLMNLHDGKQGWRWLTGFLLALVVLVAFYIWSHAQIPNTAEPVSQELGIAVDDLDRSLRNFTLGSVVSDRLTQLDTELNPIRPNGSITLTEQLGAYDQAKNDQDQLALVNALSSLRSTATSETIPVPATVLPAIDSARTSAVRSLNGPLLNQTDVLSQSLQRTIERNPQALGDAQQREAQERVGELGQALARPVDNVGLVDRQAALQSLAQVRDIVQPPLRNAFAWQREPYRTLEILLWGLAGVLAKLIYDLAGYLRWRRYFPEGAALHLAQLVVTPLTTLVVVLLLSSFALQIRINDSQVALDLRDPVRLAAVAFVLGFGPWTLVDFIRDASSFITRRERVAPTSRPAATTENTTAS